MDQMLTVKEDEAKRITPSSWTKAVSKCCVCHVKFFNPFPAAGKGYRNAMPSNGQPGTMREWRQVYLKRREMINKMNFLVKTKLSKQNKKTYFKALNLSFSWEFSGGSQSNDDSAIPAINIKDNNDNGNKNKIDCTIPGNTVFAQYRPRL